MLASRAFFKRNGMNTTIHFVNFCGLWNGSPLFVNLTCLILGEEDIEPYSGELDSMQQMKVDLKQFYYNELTDDELEQID